MTQSVTMEDMRGRLLTLETVREKLEQTEPIESISITTTTPVHYEFQPGWEAELGTKSATAPVQATVDVSGTEYRLTKDAALQACANIGLSAAYVRKTPNTLIQDALNYHYSHGVGGKDMNALVVQDNLAAFSPTGITPFSNLQLLDEVEAGLRARYGKSADILADYKFGNSLLATNVRLIVMDDPHTITGGHMRDIPTNGQDTWYSGVNLNNSLAGKSMTTIESYLFRFWCTNGAISTMDNVGTWNRRLNTGVEADVYAWARDSVEEILGGMEHKFDEIQNLTSLTLGGSNTAEVLRQIFAEWEVPVSQRDAIRDELLGAEELNLYTIMQAITRVANSGDLSPARADRLMRIGGALPTRHHDSLKAKIWREGHEANDDTNPYELVVG